MAVNYTLWDIPSSSLLLETCELSRIAESTAAYVHDNGEAALEDLLLGIATEQFAAAREHTGTDILRAIEQEASDGTYR